MSEKRDYLTQKCQQYLLITSNLFHREASTLISDAFQEEKVLNMFRDFLNSRGKKKKK